MDFRVKHRPDGNFERLKSRLVAKDFHQRPEINFHYTFSHVVQQAKILIFLHVVISRDWNLR